MRKIILTGDRPTGALHLGHYVGSLKKRVELQNTGEYKQYVLIADLQALTDNAENPEKIQQNVMELMLDYLAVGLTTERTAFVIQSAIPALYELPMFYSNLVTMARLERNPTVKTEIRLRNFQRDIPVGFMTYPISQAADITAFDADIVPVGVDQLPMIEQTRDIVASFNRIYGKGEQVLVEPKAVLPDNENCYRLVGTDGAAKMSKSLGNCIYLKEGSKELEKKVRGMFTDPNHLRVEDPGDVVNNPVFNYLDAFCRDEHFAEFLPEYQNLDELKAHYTRGGLGDVKVKRLLNDVLQNLIGPIRERREYFEQRKPEVLEILKQGTEDAIERTNNTLVRVREAIGINYFELFEKQFRAK